VLGLDLSGLVPGLLAVAVGVAGGWLRWSTRQSSADR
jgi:hypothetical protein